MTAADVLVALWRRWYIAFVGMVLTAAACISLSPGQHVYSARSTVVFLPPGSAAVSQTDDFLRPYLVNFAAMVRLALPDDPGGGNDRASFGGSLVGAGVKSGYAVVLPNSGGQWSQYYNQPVLTVESVDATPQAAENQTRSLMRQIDQAAADLQAKLNIPAALRVTTSAQSAAVEIVDGGATPSTRLRGLLSVVALGTFCTTVGTVTVDRLLRRSRRDRQRSVRAGAVHASVGGGA
ncbi:MAG: hypothetical protein HOQ07_05565 [Sinomonas sp.]|nr:hypothetical protein [Sinomonas sp.]